MTNIDGDALPSREALSAADHLPISLAQSAAWADAFGAADDSSPSPAQQAARQALGRRLKDARLGACRSRAVAAESIGIGVATLEKLEAGDRLTPLAVARAMSYGLGADDFVAALLEAVQSADVR